MSPNGTYDQGGNVWEWSDTIIDGSNRGLRGGSYFNVAIVLAASTQSSTYPFSSTNGIGFRVASVAAVPVPSLHPVGLAMIGGLMGIGLWWKVRD